jgi:hypothetical protein
MNTSNAAMKSSIRYAKNSSDAAMEVYKVHENEEARLYRKFKDFCYLCHMVHLNSLAPDDDLMTPNPMSPDTITHIEENLSQLLSEIVEINKSRGIGIPISAYAAFHQWSIVYASARKNGLARPILSSIEEHLMQALNTMIAANKP